MRDFEGLSRFDLETRRDTDSGSRREEDEGWRTDVIVGTKEIPTSKKSELDI